MALWVAVVGFHHQEGNRIEFMHPQIPHPEPMPEWLKMLPFFGLPDGAHSSDQDTIWFEYDTPQAKVYCTACYRQIDIADVYQVTPDMNRSMVQKSIILMSDAPVYGLMEQRIQPMVELFFHNGPDQFNHQILIDWFSQIQLPVSIDHIQEQLDISVMMNLLQSNVLRILKLVLIQRKILVYGHPAHAVCKFIATLLSLLPGELEQEHIPLTQECEEFHLPFHLFDNKDRLVQPYLPVQKIMTLHSASSFLVGACNMLFTQPESPVKPDIIVHVEDGRIEVNNFKVNQLMRLSTADEAFISRICQTASESDPSSWQGSDSWIRKEFLEYLKRLCAVAAVYNQTDLRSSSDEQNEAVEDFNMAWFHAWQSTQAFRSWKEEVTGAPLPETPLRHVERDQPDFDDSFSLSQSTEKLWRSVSTSASSWISALGGPFLTEDKKEEPSDS